VLEAVGRPGDRFETLLVDRLSIDYARAVGSFVDPLEQMFAYDYRISGSWSDPVVERVGARAPPGAQGTPPAAPAAPASANPVPSIGATK